MSVFGVGITFLYIIFTRLQHVTGTECQVIVTLGAQLLDKKTKTTGRVFCKTMKNKLALLWGEAQKQIAYSYLKVT